MSRNSWRPLTAFSPPARRGGSVACPRAAFAQPTSPCRYPSRFGYAGVISGYFAPADNLVPIGNRPAAPAVYTPPFPGHPELLKKNSPDVYVTRLPPGTLIPQFFLAAGADDTRDVQAAASFRQQVQLYQANVPLVLVPNATHNATAWRGALRPMFSWMTPQLTHQAQLADDKNQFGISSTLGHLSGFIFRKMSLNFHASN